MFSSKDVFNCAIGLILTVQLGQQISCLTCYQCTIHPPNAYSNETARLCSHFDYSSKFHVDCPYSTFCMKKTFELELQHGKKVKANIRDCAPQRYNHQVFKDGRWEVENSIENDVYTVGCHQEKTLGIKIPNAEYCYCATNLCNSAQSSRDASSTLHHTDTMAVIFIFNVMKYIHSLR